MNNEKFGNQLGQVAAPPSDHDKRRTTYDASVTSEGIPAASASKRHQQGIELVSNDIDCTDLVWKRNLEA